MNKRRLHDINETSLPLRNQIGKNATQSLDQIPCPKIFLINTLKLVPRGFREVSVLHLSCTLPCHITRLQFVGGRLFNTEPIIFKGFLFVSNEGKPSGFLPYWNPVRFSQN